MKKRNKKRAPVVCSVRVFISKKKIFYFYFSSLFFNCIRPESNGILDWLVTGASRFFLWLLFYFYLKKKKGLPSGTIGGKSEGNTGEISGSCRSPPVVCILRKLFVSPRDRERGFSDFIFPIFFLFFMLRPCGCYFYCRPLLLQHAAPFSLILDGQLLFICEKWPSLLWRQERNSKINNNSFIHSFIQPFKRAITHLARYRLVIVLWTRLINEKR